MNTSAPAVRTPGKRGKMAEKGYRKLIVWQKANELAYAIYIITKDFPKDEVYGVTSQLRRSALSVPTNIVEGYGRQGKGELRQFANIALGSLAETEYLLDFSLKLGYFSQENHNKLQGLRQEVGNLLWKFYKNI
ncbi:MAG: four helix bundle protein [Candidatus Omnitrophica bacterium]|nr:four helix bundle protein [Candidatus Omnitrophota bacterium]MDD5430433.1 four helix bundle protein [Candidatus Omnitrophota bacterium]